MENIQSINKEYFVTKLKKVDFKIIELNNLLKLMQNLDII